jgi:hypothetical protein
MFHEPTPALMTVEMTGNLFAAGKHTIGATAAHGHCHARC